MSNVDFSRIQDKFEEMGAKLRVVVHEPPTEQTRTSHGRVFRWMPRRPEPFRANVLTDRKRGEHFVFDVLPEDVRQIQVLDVNRKDRHLLISILANQPNVKNPEPQKLLMGHDERHWFVAAVPRSATNVDTAKQALKPKEIVDTQAKAKVKAKNKHKRRGGAYIRQGEWFFVPVDITLNEQLVLKNEPIQRGRSKPHVCQEFYRFAGEAVYVNLEGKTLTPAQWSRLSVEERRKGHYMQRTRVTAAYARGTVKHPDHKTVYLQGWHKIVGNAEISSARTVAFLD